MRGPRSEGTSNEDLEQNELANDVWPSLDCTTWPDMPLKMPFTCLETLEGTTQLEPPSPSGEAIKSPIALLCPSQGADLDYSPSIQAIAGNQPFDTACTITLAPALNSPARDTPPPQPAALDMPPLPVALPAWAEPQTRGGVQRAAATCVPAVVAEASVQGPDLLGMAAEPPSTHFQQPLLPVVPVAPKAGKPRRGFVQRNKAKVAVNGANYSGLLAQKAALERELVTLLNRHERLSRGLPWHMQHEEVSFMASIARCVAAGHPGTLPARVEPVMELEPSEKLIQDLMLDPCATMNDVYQAAGIGSAFPAGCDQPLDSGYLDVLPEKNGTKAEVWSSVATFLKLSKPQKDNLLRAYDAHVQRAAALQRECLTIGTQLQADDVLKPKLATHLACGHLTGIAKEVKDLLFLLNKECYEVLNQVQLNNLFALAPAGSAAVLELCREIAAPRGAAAAKTAAAATAAGTPLTERHQNATRPMDASPNAMGGTINTGEGAIGSGVVTADIFADVDALATKAGGAAKAPKKTLWQPTIADQATGAGAQAGTLARMLAAGATPSRNRKRQMPESFWDSDEDTAPKT